MQDTNNEVDSPVPLSRLLFPLLPLILLCSCTGFWSGSNQRKFKEVCADEAIKWAASEEQADAYCKCVLDKMMRKYPDEEDALMHMGDLAMDTSLINCREEVMMK